MQILRVPSLWDTGETPFWEASDALCAAAGLHFKSIEGGCVVLTNDEDTFGKLESVGEPYVE